MDERTEGPRLPGGGPSRLTRLRTGVSGPLLGVVLRRVPLRTLGRWIAVGLAVLLPSIAWGVATASAHGNLGPHTALYQITLEHEVTVDLGPIGTLVVDSPLPVLGARVVVQEIPREVTSVEASTTLDALSQDLEKYVQLFSGPEATLQVAARALIHDAVRRSAVAVVVLTALLLLLRAALGDQRRTELRMAARPHRMALVAAGTITVLVVGTITASEPLRPDPSGEVVASAVFDDTPLEGARITGRLAGVIDTYGGYAVKAYRDNQAFYAAATDAVRAAWQVSADRDERLAAVRQAPPVASTTGDPPTEPVVMVLVSDLHCNIGMAEVIGTVVESYCVTAFADAVPDGATMLVVTGNHDSPETAAQERRAGMRVLEGEVVEVDGVRILGDADPRTTRIGVGTTLVGDEDMTDLSSRLARTACDDPEGVDLLLVHDPSAGDDALAQGCVPAQLSGHLHRRIGPSWLGHGTRYVSSSTAGAELGASTIGPLNGIAELTVLRIDPDSGRVLDYRLVQIRPDASAAVGLALDWPGERPDLHQAVVQDPPRVRVDAQDGELGDPVQRPDGAGAQLGARCAARDVPRAVAQPGRTDPAVQVTGQLGRDAALGQSFVTGARVVHEQQVDTFRVVACRLGQPAAQVGHVLVGDEDM